MMLNADLLPEVYGLGLGTQISCASRVFGYVRLHFAVPSITEITTHSFQIIITLIPLLSPDSPKLDFPPTSLASLTPLLPCLVLCSLFFSSTIFTESISKAKYPVAYSAYQERVAMFLPVLTPVWGALLGIQGRKGSVDSMVYGDGPNSKGKGKAE